MLQPAIKRNYRTRPIIFSPVKYLEDTLSQASSADYLVVAYSGGKDSTLLMHFAIKYVLKTRIPVTIVSSDTLVENPLIASHVKRTLLRLDNFLKRQKLKPTIRIVSPEPHNTYWVHLIGKGYPLPHIRFRWCQRALKIKPVERFLKSLPGNPALLLGHRTDESKVRRNTPARRQFGKIQVFTPLLPFREEDVWNFLMTEEPVWGGTFDDVIELYKEARGECPLVGSSSFQSGCGSRFGCWVCTLVKDDRAMRNLIQTGRHENLRPYYEFRKWLISFCNKPENRYPYTRTGKPVRMGCLTHRARRSILRKLRILERQTGSSIISLEEIKIIRQCWRDELCMIS